ARSGRGSLTQEAARTRASLTSGRGRAGGRTRLAGGQLLLQRLDLPLDLRDERIVRILREELLVEGDLQGDVSVLPGGLAGGEERGRVARRQRGQLLVDADVLTDHLGEDVRQLRRLALLE